MGCRTKVAKDCCTGNTRAHYLDTRVFHTLPNLPLKSYSCMRQQLIRSQQTLLPNTMFRWDTRAPLARGNICLPHQQAVFPREQMRAGSLQCQARTAPSCCLQRPPPRKLGKGCLLLRQRDQHDDVERRLRRQGQQHDDVKKYATTDSRV
ncbi:unnamed protein product, partial [Ectocarpus sp. 12 AP-2014]